jgi:alkanesulfonate monooxygenase SsuD/methylene tetrahydromethanopterin reductase-like flavin-dependent oxidoreductase (luciferase family)
VPVEIGIFTVPDASDPQGPVRQIVAAEEAGLDLVGVQDHPYQRRFHDTWTLLSYTAAKTERIKLVPDVVNLPLRQPAMLAKAAASLDLLSGGRVELGLGAGAFWEAIEAMGGPRRTGKESVDALEEAIAIIRSYWAGDRSVSVEGEHYRVKGAKPGPLPAHPIGLWIGAYGPRMLRLTGRLGDGWLPSVGGDYVSAENAPKMQAAVDEGARAAGRDPGDVLRAANVTGVEGSSEQMAAGLTEVVELGFTTLIVSVPGEDPVDFIRRLGDDVAPIVRPRSP